MDRFLLLDFPFFTLLLVSCSEITGTTLPASQIVNEHVLLSEETQDEIALGKAIYAANCASCHGENLEGEANWKQQNEDESFRSPPHTADGHTWHHADTVLIEAIREGGARFEGLNIGGTSNMPAFADTLSDEEILAVLAYIKSTWPEDIRAVQRQQTMQDTSS